jgi:urease accessory protein UreF
MKTTAAAVAFAVLAAVVGVEADMKAHHFGRATATTKTSSTNKVCGRDN